jgi:cytochrome oxidase Cu insertion factor (SCO1/SenC/PrrC family)
VSGRSARALLAALALAGASASTAPGCDSSRSDAAPDAASESRAVAAPGLFEEQLRELSALPPAGSYELPPIARVPDFWLLDESGARAPLLGLEAGQVALVSLVYTHCPAACPAALSIVQQVDRQVAREPALRAGVRLVTVSFDPERDDPSKMAALRKRLAPVSDWRFLTAESADAIQPLLDAFGQDALRLVLSPEAGGEEEKTPLLRHVLKLYLVDARGDVRNIYSSGLMSPELLMADLRTLLFGPRVARGDLRRGSRRDEGSG